MIEARELRKVYKTKKGVTVNALDGVSLKLADTGMVFILGKSGSGKSTLLNVLGGLDSFDSGEIIIKGTSAKDFKQGHYDSYRNTYIGFIFQEYNVLEELTVGANIALAIELQGRKATNEEVNEILREVDLDGYGSRKPNELSGGQKQRVAIARALVKKPEIIMADEPTGALDSATGKQVFDTLKKLSHDKLVLIVSHDREFSEQYADRIIELKDGVIISDVEKTSLDKEISEEVEDSITYGENEITVKAGYVITEEDRVAINEYLATLSAGAVIKLDKGRKKRISAADFIPTDESRIKTDKKGDFKLIKSKLSLKNAFKLGSGALKHKKVRLVITIFLSLISFTLFGVSDVIAAYNSVATTTASIHDTGVDYASYVKHIRHKSDDYEYWNSYDTTLTLEDVENIRRETGRKVLGVYKQDYNLSYHGNVGDEKTEGKRLEAIYFPALSGLAAIDSQLLSEFGFTMLGSSRLPSSDSSEIVITKYAYDYFEKAGYVNYTHNGQEKSEINTYDDLIGKTLNLDIAYKGENAFKIVGIVDTGFDYSRYERLADENAEHTMNMVELMTLSAELESAQSYSFACIGFVGEKFISDLIAADEGKAESLDNAGYIELFFVADDSKLDTDTGIVFDENILGSMHFSYLNSLEKIRESVSWTNGPIENLSDNQIIVPISIVDQLLTSYRSYPEAYYDAEKLVGIEKQFYENAKNWGINIYGLQSIFSNIKFYSALYYAIENYDVARAELIDYYVDCGMSEADAEAIYKGDAVYNDFAIRVSEGFIDAEGLLVSREFTKAYINGIISRYGLSEYVMSEDMKNALVKTFTYEGNEYSSYDKDMLVMTLQLNHIKLELMAYHYAATYFTDALDYYKIYNGNDDVAVNSETVPEILEAYAWYIMSGSTIDGFVSAADIGFDEYKPLFLVGLYKSATQSSKIALNIRSYVNHPNSLLKNIEIVGFLPDNAADMVGKYDFRIVVSENIINGLLGANRGGVYTYAVGSMPKSLGDIREIVKFSKGYTVMDGNVKYHLTNNVTGQLDMVEGILEVLGQVFLYVGIGFALFASLMLANFISTSIAYKKQEIGILRAIGSRSGDVFRIFFAESFIIAMINYILSIIGTLSVTLVINGILRNEAGLLITFLNFGVRQVAVLLLVSLAVAFVATFLPVKKIASMKPIDAIKNRK